RRGDLTVADVRRIHRALRRKLDGANLEQGLNIHAARLAYMVAVTYNLCVGDLAAAIEACDEAIARLPGEPDTHVMRGICLYPEQKDAAINSFRRAIELKSADPIAYVVVALDRYN